MKKLKTSKNIIKKYRILHIATGIFFEVEFECGTKYKITLKEIQESGCSMFDCVYDCDNCIWHTAKRIEFDVVRLYDKI